MERIVTKFRLIWIVSIYVRSFTRGFMPPNMVLTTLRTRRGLKWGLPSMLLVIPYLLAASCVTVFINYGASKCLYIITIVCVWNALKFIANGIVSISLFVRVRLTNGVNNTTRSSKRSSLASDRDLTTLRPPAVRPSS